MIQWAVALLIASSLFSIVRVIVYRRRMKRSAKLPPKQEPPRCVCGYDLSGLPLPRCPECGRLAGFDKTIEELELTEEDLARMAEKRQAREQLDR
jgi:hypothetical protein